MERFNFYTKRRKDLFNFIDIVAIRPGEILAIQTTSSSNMSARIQKIMSLPAAKHWIDAGGEIIVHGWSKKGPRGKRKLWTLDERPVVP